MHRKNKSVSKEFTCIETLQTKLTPKKSKTRWKGSQKGT